MIILAHRGYSSKYPQNTLLAFKKAMEYGADGVELDVWRTKDGKIVVSHDGNLKKVFGVDVEIRKRDYEDLLQYKQEGEKIPLLKEVYELLPENALINVEIKDVNAVEGALEIAKKYNAMERTIFSSFLLEALQKLRSLDEGARIGILPMLKGASGAFLLPKSIIGLHAEFVNLPYQMKEVIGIFRSRALIRYYRLFVAKISIWTPNKPKDLEGFERLYEVIITDNVEGMLQFKEK